MLRTVPAAVAAAAFASPAHIKHFPTNPIRLVAAFADGAPTDTVARGVAEATSWALAPRRDASSR
jgi:tripartite-type tricarboxylate transporter receptor subunit TctC